MTAFSLDQVRIASPCPMRWDDLAPVGDGEQVRHCSQCNLHVYNLSGMTRDEAEALLSGAEGRLCVRYYARADGTVLTRDCPVGLRALRQRAARRLARLAAAVGLLATAGSLADARRASWGVRLRGVDPFATVCRWLRPPPTPLPPPAPPPQRMEVLGTSCG